MTRFLHAADLHIDSPLRGLTRYEDAPVERLRTATRAALENLVDLAISERVDFVLLAGDIYDQDWQDFHTGLFFREQMTRLDRAAIRVFMVRGNHDAQGVISRPLPLPGNVTVFSSRRAESVFLDDLGIAIHGHSFPARAIPEDLVPTYPAPKTGFFNIGLLHTSLGGRPPHDTYAPTEVWTLNAKGYDYWALGHVHAREVVSEAAPRIVFPGNLQGRRPHEMGPKGCEMVTVNAGGVESEFIALDVVRWHALTLPLENVVTREDLTRTFRDTVEPLVAAAGDRLHAIRITLLGATPLALEEANHPGLLDAILRTVAQDLRHGEVWLEQTRLHIANPIDRERDRARDDAVGELIRLVDAIGADETALRAFSTEELGVLLNGLPPEIAAETLALANHEDLQGLLRDAEATIIARLAATGARP